MAGLAAPRREPAGGDLSPAPRRPVIVVESADEPEWPPLGTVAVACATVFILWLLLRASSGDHWVPLLDHANLAFHEAGHVIVGLLSDRLSVYGGMLGQLVFPAVAAWQFRQRRHTLGFVLCVGWGCESLLNVATYMADARAMQLPLIGGLDPETHHDWREIFRRWGVLDLDTSIATVVRVIAWGTGVATCAWSWRRWLDGRE